jgi:hypothetical protein
METKVKFVACDMPEATPFTLHILCGGGPGGGSGDLS